jgi:hypothetical protein
MVLTEYGFFLLFCACSRLQVLLARLELTEHAPLLNDKRVASLLMQFRHSIATCPFSLNWVHKPWDF